MSTHCMKRQHTQQMAQQPHTNEQRETVRAAFAHFDDDGSGAIDAEELRDLVAKLGGYLTDSELQAALSALDRDGNGVVDENEFAAWWMAQGSDLDGDGQIGELERAMERVKASGQSRFHVDIHSAAWRGTLSAVQRLLECDGELANAVDATEYGCGNTPLHYAAHQGHHDVCAALLTGGAKINATNSFGCTPLFLAAQQSRLGVVQLLLEHGGDVRIVEREHKFTAIDVCSSDEVLAAIRVRSGGVPGTPDAPTIASTTDTSLIVEWSAPKDRHDQIAPISGYKLKATPSSQASATPVCPTLVGAQPTRYELHELQPDTEYIVHVAAINLHGISTYSAGSAVTRTLPARPAALTRLRARAVGPTSVELTWDASEAGDLVCVVQQRVDQESDLWKAVGKVGASTGCLEISDLFEGRKYYFRATVVNSNGARSDYVVVEARTAKEGEMEHPITARSARRPSEKLRGVVNATSRLRSEAKTTRKKEEQYPSPQEAVELQIRKPRLATLARAAAKPSSQPALASKQLAKAREAQVNESRDDSTRPISSQEQNLSLECKETKRRHIKQTADRKLDDDTDEDDYVYFSDDPDSEEEDDATKQEEEAS